MDAKEIELLQDGYRYAFALTHNKEDADDLVQDCWLKLYEKKGLIESRSFFFTVIRNKFIDQYRRNKIVKMEGEEHIEVVAAKVSDVHDKILVKQINEALNYLNPKEREALYLQCIEEYTAIEISEMTGQPRGSVLSLVSRARKKLIKLMNLNEDNDNVINFKQRAS